MNYQVNAALHPSVFIILTRFALLVISSYLTRFTLLVISSTATAEACFKPCGCYTRKVEAGYLVFCASTGDTRLHCCRALCLDLVRFLLFSREGKCGSLTTPPMWGAPKTGDTASNAGTLALLDSYEATKNLPVSVACEEALGYDFF